MGYDKTIVGSVGSSAEDFDAAIAVLPTLDTSAFTGCILPLSEFQTAWKVARSGEHLKVILQVETKWDV